MNHNEYFDYACLLLYGILCSYSAYNDGVRVGRKRAYEEMKFEFDNQKNSKPDEQ